MARNYKLWNHWIAEVRELALKKNLMRDAGEDGLSNLIPLDKSDIKYLFNRATMYESFIDEQTPEEALSNELAYWE